MEWVSCLAGAAGGYWLLFRVCESVERRYQPVPPDWVLIMGAPPFFFLFVLGGGFCGLLCQDIVFDHGRVARYLLHIMG